jgi:hypothetical protein
MSFLRKISFQSHSLSIREITGYWKSKIYRERTKREIIDGAFGRWRNAGRLDY